jgi:hypothetical protein
MSQKIEDAFVKSTVGLQLIGDWLNNLISFTTDIHDEYLRCVLYFSEYKKFPETQEDIMTEQMDAWLAETKSRIMNIVRIGINIETRRDERRQHYQDKQEKQQQAINTRNAFNAMHKPDPQGTVKEISEKYGVSLGEVRRLKREGKLGELTNPTSE